MKRTEKLAKQYGCTESQMNRAILVILMTKIENLPVNAPLDFAVSDNEIHDEMSRKGFGKKKSPALTILK